jgi:aspartyl/asparaginyl-tRNA synthetase
MLIILFWESLARVHISHAESLEVRDRPEPFFEKIKKTSDRSKILDRREIAAVARIESSLISGARKYLEKNGFIEVTVPHITKATGLDMWT